MTYYEKYLKYKNKYLNLLEKSYFNSFEIEENVLLLFPSWLKHYVNPNLSNEDRISLSFNTNFKN